MGIYRMPYEDENYDPRRELTEIRWNERTVCRYCGAAAEIIQVFDEDGRECELYIECTQCGERAQYDNP